MPIEFCQIGPTEAKRKWNCWFFDVFVYNYQPISRASTHRFIEPIKSSAQQIHIYPWRLQWSDFGKILWTSDWCLPGPLLFAWEHWMLARKARYCAHIYAQKPYNMHPYKDYCSPCGYTIEKISNYRCFEEGFWEGFGRIRVILRRMIQWSLLTLWTGGNGYSRKNIG